ncbi:MAG: A/G-specific adenine glycosylase, partial [Spirochaetaceae bacterium]|nr:A/G-specific adenine glycosylase [Spirochaetaceae bacterium]
GIGIYTSRAILAFAFNRPVVFLETNIRTVLLKHFYPEGQKVSDALLEEVAAYVLDAGAPAKWYSAMMDYGVEIKRLEGNHTRRSSSYHKQSPFDTSFRRVRGQLLKVLVAESPMDVEDVYRRLPFSRENIEKSIDELAEEGFISYSGGRLALVDH